MSDILLSQAYIIGVALGDGNLSRPNGRATRLRVTCDNKYPTIISDVCIHLQIVFPNNKVSVVNERTGDCIDVSVYSNRLNQIMPWRVGEGSKIAQQAHVPQWILDDSKYIKPALRGLIQTDGSIYVDRGYKMVNFTNNIKPLIHDVYFMMQTLGFKPRVSKTLQKSGNLKYTVRLSREVEKFISLLEIKKE